MKAYEYWDWPGVWTICMLKFHFKKLQSWKGLQERTEPNLLLNIMSKITTFVIVMPYHLVIKFTIL